MTAEFEILTLLNRYLHGVDTRNREQIAGCFTPDAVAVFPESMGGGASREEIVGLIEKAGALSGERWGASMHALGNWKIELVGETEARSSMNVEAVLADFPRGSGSATRRGLCYTDELVKTSEGWQIRRRLHELLWSYTADNVALSAATHAKDGKS